MVKLVSVNREGDFQSIVIKPVKSTLDQLDPSINLSYQEKDLDTFLRGKINERADYRHWKPVHIFEANPYNNNMMVVMWGYTKGQDTQQHINSFMCNMVSTTSPLYADVLLVAFKGNERFLKHVIDLEIGMVTNLLNTIIITSNPNPNPTTFTNSIISTISINSTTKEEKKRGTEPPSSAVVLSDQRDNAKDSGKEKEPKHGNGNSGRKAKETKEELATTVVATTTLEDESLEMYSEDEFSNGDFELTEDEEEEDKLPPDHAVKEVEDELDEFEQEMEGLIEAEENKLYSQSLYEEELTYEPYVYPPEILSQIPCLTQSV